MLRILAEEDSKPVIYGKSIADRKIRTKEGKRWKRAEQTKRGENKCGKA